MKLRYIVAALLAVLTISFFGCVPENEKGNEETTAEITAASEDGTSAPTTTKSGGAFGEVQEQGTFPSISFDEFK